MAISPNPPSAGIQYTPYNVSNVLYARYTGDNSGIAQQNDGGTANSVIEQIIEPPTLATGLINTVSGDTLVTGTSTTFNLDFNEGDFLFYYSADGNAVLLGQIEEINTPTSMVLKDGALSTVVNKNAGGSFIKLSIAEQILIRIPVVASEIINNVVTKAIIPSINDEWRINGGVAGNSTINNSGTSSIVRYSNPGDVISIDSTSTLSERNMPFTLESMNIFEKGNINDTFWTAGKLPNFIWFLFTPSSNLSQSTMYKLFTKIVFTKGVIITQDYPVSLIRQLGYTS